MTGGWLSVNQWGSGEGAVETVNIRWLFFFFFSIRCNVHEIYLHYLGLFQTIICNLPETLRAKGL